MGRSLEIADLNNRILDISDQDRMLASLSKLGRVDPDIFIARSNQPARLLRAAKLERKKVPGSANDGILSKPQELPELLETAPDFDEDIFPALADRIIVNTGGFKFAPQAVQKNMCRTGRIPVQ